MALASARPSEFRAESIPRSIASSSEEAEAPALSSSRALARFEFESGRGNEGTKILMIEWEDDSDNADDWQVEWSSKTTVLSARDGTDGSLHRIYFLLAPGVNVPPIVRLSQGGKTIQTNPLPALFPPELGVSATTAGKKGVLHTVWGKQRLSVLQKEIEAEMKKNGEGIGLEIALQEKQWIEENFGVSAKAAPGSSQQRQTTPTSPKPPSGGKLSEKLKGLKLGTSASELNATNAENGSQPSSHRSAHPLSPDLGDVAISSFSAFHGTGSTPRSSRTPTAAGSAQKPVSAATSPFVSSSRQSDQLRHGSRINSLDAVATGDVGVSSNANSVANVNRAGGPVEDPGTEDGLFAVRMSPRSPEMTKSPFSFAAKDAAPWTA